MSEFLLHNQGEFEKIRYDSERRVAEFLLTVNPNLQVTYEPRVYTIDPEVAAEKKIKKKTTVPDFEIMNPETGDTFLLEVTEQRSASCKSKQRKVMEHSAPGVTYVVFSRNDLAAIATLQTSGDAIDFEGCGRTRVQKVGEMIIPKPEVIQMEENKEYLLVS